MSNIRVLPRSLSNLGSVVAVWLVFFMLSPGLLFAGDRLEGFEFELYSGYRTDQLDWNIAWDYSGTITPNIHSELTWDDLDIYQVGSESNLRISNIQAPFLLLITGSVNYGTIVAGSSQDSDYAGDNRTLEFSRSNNDSSDGDVWDVSLGLGPEFTMAGGKLALTPLAGYSYHEQNLQVTNGFQTIPADGAFPGLNSTYDTVWKGGWVGINLKLSPDRTFSLTSRVEYHVVEFLADADWNLRTDFKHPVSFSHYADEASGLVAKLAADLAISEKLHFVTEVSYMKWQAENGVDTVFLSNNSISKTRLNEVNWESAGVVVGLKMLFN